MAKDNKIDLSFTNADIRMIMWMMVALAVVPRNRASFKV